jgi:hypothetical protein
VDEERIYNLDNRVPKNATVGCKSGGSRRLLSLMSFNFRLKGIWGYVMLSGEGVPTGICSLSVGVICLGVIQGTPHPGIFNFLLKGI